MESQASKPYPPRSRYSGSLIALHWLTLLLIVAAYASAELREELARGSDLRAAMTSTHHVAGLMALALLLVRLPLRWWNGSVPVHPPLPPLQRMAAGVGHLALYLFLLAMPLLGWLLLSAEGKPVDFAGLTLPALIEANRNLAEQVEDLHEAGAMAGYYLIGLHAAAALFHHYVRRDNTLRRMLP